MSLVHALGIGVAHAQRVVVADLYSEPDLRVESGALSLLLRARLGVGDRPTVPRSELIAALDRMAPTSGRALLTVDPTRAPDLLARVGADRLITGIIRGDGNGLAGTLHVYDDEGNLLGKVTANVSYGRLDRLSIELAAGVSELVGTEPYELVSASLASLRPFVMAHRALLRGDAKTAARFVVSADSRVARRLQPAKEITDEVIRDTTLSAEERLLAALAGADARVVIELADARISVFPRSEVAWAARALAHLAQLKPDLATKDLGRVDKSTHPLVRLARAELAHRNKNASARDEILRPLLSEDLYVPALAWASRLEPGVLGAREADVVNTAEATVLELESLGIALGYRAAVADVETDRALGLITLGDLSDEEIEGLADLIDRAVDLQWPVGYRLRAEMHLRDGETDAAILDLRRSLSANDNDPQTRLLLAQALAANLQFEQAAEVIGAMAHLAPDYQRIYARYLRRKGDVKTADAIFRDLGDETSVETQVAFAEKATADGNSRAAMLALERAIITAPEDVSVLKALARAYRAQGMPREAAAAEALVATLEAGSGKVEPIPQSDNLDGSEGAPIAEGEEGGISGVWIGLGVGLALALGVGLFVMSRRTAGPARAGPPRSGTSVRFNRPGAGSGAGAGSSAGSGASAGAGSGAVPVARAPAAELGPRRRAPSTAPSVSEQPGGAPVRPPPRPNTSRPPTHPEDPLAPLGEDRPGPPTLELPDLDRVPVPSPVPSATSLLPPTTSSMDIELPEPVQDVDSGPLDIGLGAAGAGAVAPRDPESPAGKQARRRPPQGFERYRLDAELSADDAGTLWRATDTYRDDSVTVRVFDPELMARPGAIKMMIQEAEAAVALSHGNVERVLAHGEESGTYYLVTEQTKGSSLASRMERSEFSPGRALALIGQLAAGVAHAHSKKVIHRDICPANIKLIGGKTAKLGGFAIAKLRHSYGDWRGNQLYMAPEQFEHGGIDERTDIYAMGCVAFELLTGRPPFIGANLPEQHMRIPPPGIGDLAKGLPPLIVAVLMATLAKERKDRPSSAKKLADAVS